jgi:hypothetical protein
MLRTIQRKIEIKQRNALLPKQSVVDVAAEREKWATKKVIKNFFFFKSMFLILESIVKKI